MSLNKQNSSEESYPPATPERSDGGRGKYLIPIVLIIILVVLGIIFTISNNKQTPKSANNDANNVEVINSQDLLPQTQSKQEENNTDNSPQNGPATIEDLGGNRASQQNIDDLLKDKEIEIK
ncbi:MAG: hypothetical protein M1338_03295 [Patescibacteria group bacterium]|nr:hypothetical protein [Patescibacteria group bacterium]